jgi:two-component system response regulator RegA
MALARRILLVEDDHSNRLTMAALLEDAGFHVSEAESLAHARKALSEGQVYEVVMLDRRLPDGDGLSVIATIRSALPSAYVVVLSGEKDTSPLADVCLTKGSDFSLTLSALEGLFGGVVR